MKSHDHIWPIDREAAKPPDAWQGWPEKKRFALVLTHDVDTERGHEKCRQLIKLEEELGFRSSFNFVPERYSVSRELREFLTSRGFEVGLHGLIHDGKLYNSSKIFKERAIRINRYLREWGAVGFRSPSMHHNLDWIHDLDVEYDASTFDTDPFEPQSEGVRTIFPYLVQTKNGKKYVELPYTLPQDFSLFVLMKKRKINIWKIKLDWIADNGGMVLINVHSDYMNFGVNKLSFEEYPAEYYEKFLEYILINYKDQYWHVLPKEMARFWVKNSEFIRQAKP
jgi:hypothetical protein